MRISGYTLIAALLVVSLWPSTARGQEETVAKVEKVAKALQDTTKTGFVGGLSIQADLIGLAQMALGSKFSNMEAAARLNFKNTYFPIVELGIGHGKREGQENNNRFSTTAPFFRVGMDYNFNKRKETMNRFMGGVRYAWSTFNYDFECPGFEDPVYGTTQDLRLTSQHGRAQWLEFVVGVQTRLWKFIHMGWNLRFKARLAQKTSDYGQPWYIPGYGRNSSTMWGGQVNLIFDVQMKGKKKVKNE